MGKIPILLLRIKLNMKILIFLFLVISITTSGQTILPNSFPDSIRYYKVWGYSSAYHGKDEQFFGLYLKISPDSIIELPMIDFHGDRWLRSWNYNHQVYNGDSVKYDFYLHKVLELKHEGGNWEPIYYSYPYHIDPLK